MKYKYRFSDDQVDIEVDEKWGAVLEDLDRKERNNNYSEVKKSIHYDAFDFEPDFMGEEDKALTALFDGSPAYEYAIQRIPKRGAEILLRRALKKEKFIDIATSYGIERANAMSRYYYARDRFIKFYKDGAWIYSSQNKDIPGAGKVLSIPAKLTPDQVVAIREQRMIGHSHTQIANRLGVPRNQVVRCLNENPIIGNRCPTCGNLILQVPGKKVVFFCSKKCYFAWYNNSCAKEQKHPLLRRFVLSRPQELVVQYYKQYLVSYERMRKLTGIPMRSITAFFMTKPLPYTICRNCGEKITGQADRNRIKLFCSQKCRDHYYNMEFYYRENYGVEIYGKPTIPSPDQLYMAIDMHDSGYPRDGVSACTGLTEDELEALFRYDEETVLEETMNYPLKKIKIITGSVRIINVHIWEPVVVEGTKPLYTATVLISKDDKKTIEGARAAIEAVLAKWAGKSNAVIPQKARAQMPLHDGER